MGKPPTKTMENPQAPLLPPAPLGAAATPATSLSPSEAPVFDAATLLGQLAGDRDLAAFVVQASIDAIPGNFDELERALAGGEWADARRVAHTLKGLAAQLGAKRLWQHLKGADEQLRGGGRIEIESVAFLRLEYGLLAAALQEWS